MWLNICQCYLQLTVQMIQQNNGPLLIFWTSFLLRMYCAVLYLLCRFFFGFISSQQAETILQKEPHGSFLIRFSTTEVQLAVSLKWNLQFVHTRIGYKNLQIGIELNTSGASFSNYNDLLSAHKETLLLPLNRNVCAVPVVTQ
jgi:hypothetical protein